MDVLAKYYECDLESITQNDSLSKRTITREMVEKVYEISKDVYEGKISYQNAVDKMSIEGMNSNSAAMYIDCFDRMIRGEVYKRGTSTFAAEYYIAKIREDYGKEYSKKAIESLRKHIEYLKSKNFTNKGLEEVLENQQEFDTII